MSLWHDMLVAPRIPTFLSREQFSELLLDVLHRNIVTFPCALLAGDVEVETPLGVANLFIDHHYENGNWVVTPFDYPPGTVIPTDEGSVTVYAYGEDEIALFKALFEAPYGERDLCIWFDNLDFKNEDIANSYFSGTDVLVYALATTRSVCYAVEQQESASEDGDEENEAETALDFRLLPVQCCFRTTAKGGPYRTCKAMNDVFARHYGNDFVVGCFYS